MMHTIRKVVVFLLFAILIVAFAISMGGNYSFDRFSHPNVVKVGSIEVTPQQFHRAYERAVENLSARAGRRITASQAKSLGMPARVLQELIQESAIDFEAKKLGLGLSETGLRQSITGNDIFQDSTGKFSPEKYRQIFATDRIQRARLRVRISQRSDTAGRSRASSRRAGSFRPRCSMLSTATSTSNGPSPISPSMRAPPELSRRHPMPRCAASYEDRKTKFMAPELRKVALLAIAPQTIARRIAVSDEELQADYDAKAAEYAVPQRRKIERHHLPDKRGSGIG